MIEDYFSFYSINTFFVGTLENRLIETVLGSFEHPRHRFNLLGVI